MRKSVHAEQEGSDYDGERKEYGRKREVAGGLADSKRLFTEGISVEVVHSHPSINYGPSSENGIVCKYEVIIPNL
jgi:hypothetical protein